jgi:lycopene beta-cyclase
MTYWQFHVVFILPVLALLWWVRPKAMLWSTPLAGLKAIGLTGLFALVYTFPWDNYLIAKGGWSYPADRVLATVRAVPVEEILFFGFMTALTGLLALQYLKRAVPGNVVSAGVKWSVFVVYIALAVAGWWMLARGGQWFYMGMIFGFFFPVLALSWGVGGQFIAAYPRQYWAPIIISTLYLWVCDWFAIVKQGIWSLSTETSTGLNVLGLPLEEMLFFLVVNMVVVQSVMLFSHPQFSRYLGRA